MQGDVDPDKEAALHDGITPDGGGFQSSAIALPITFTVDLAGDNPAPIAGVILDSQSDQVPTDWIKDFDLLLSTDGVDYTVALSGTMQPLATEQSFVLDKPVDAKYAQLRVRSTYGTAAGATGGLALGEWKVIATPGFVPAGSESIDVANLSLGGHIVSMDPQWPDPKIAEAMLTPDTALQSINMKPGTQANWVVGFNEDRAAEVTGLQWVDPDGSSPDTRFNSVQIEISTTSPLGPWTAVGTWKLQRADDGSVQPFAFDQPIWARFIRFTGAGPKGKDEVAWEYPAEIRVLETPTSDTYRSIVGQWGYGVPSGIYEVLQPPAEPAASAGADNDNTPETGTDLAAGKTANGRVQIGNDVDWYTVQAPADQNTLTFTLTGTPIEDAAIHVFDDKGTEIPATLAAGKDPTVATYVVEVDPGATYHVRVEQPPHSIIFAFDTSTSIAPYEPYLKEGLKSFASDITPGQEFVNLMPFSEKLALPDWADQPYLVQSAVNSYVDESLSSSSEETIINASQALAGRDGAKAILLVTDGATSSYDKMAAMWTQLAAVDPRIFAVHIGAGDDPLGERHFMQDWAAAGFGFYQYTQTQGEMDRALDRAATWLRRPTDYTITFTASQQEATPTPAPTNTPEPTNTPQPTNTPAPTDTPAPTETPTPTLMPSATPTATATVDQSKPGSLQVVGGRKTNVITGQTATISQNIAIEIVLDTSGSMLQDLGGGQTRIDVARQVLTDLVTTKIPAGAPVALRTFGNQPGSCDTQLAVPLSPLDPSSMASVIQGVQVTNLVKTPIGASLEEVANDLAGVSGPKVVILVTDGEETCDGDPAQAIQDLVAQGINVQVNIVGFALDDDALRATFKQWAQLGNGSYFDATNSSELNSAVTKALEPPFQVYDAAGNLIATGRVDGSSFQLPPGFYTVVVLTDPLLSYSVTIEPGKKTKVDISKSDGGLSGG